MTTATRYLRFNLVGLFGMAVQITTLALLNRILRGHYLLATALAIELTLLHNFFWHTRYTWRDRTPHQHKGCPVHDDGSIVGMSGPAPCSSQPAYLHPLARFHLSNGLVSLIGNLGLMALFVHQVHAPVLLANIAAIAVCSIANFTLSHRWAFLPDRAASCAVTVSTLFVLSCSHASAQTAPLPEAPPHNTAQTPPKTDSTKRQNISNYFLTAGSFCALGASSSPVSTKPTIGCGIGADLLLVPIFFEVGVMGPQANRSYLSGYYSADGRLPLFLPTKTTVAWGIIGYSRLFETGHSFDYGLALSLPRSAKDPDSSYRMELRDYYTLANPSQHNIVLRVGWVTRLTD